jgi:dolichol-phosphate mannosyltransferase
MSEAPATVAFDYTVVIPVYYNGSCLEAVFATLVQEILLRRSERGEIVFVDDGSGDNSYPLLKGIFQAHPECTRVIKLSRNFGQQFAVLAGLRHARGRCVVTMSADGQEPASLINGMLDKFFADGVDVVAGRRRSREDSPARSLVSRLAYGVMRRLAFPNMPRDGFDMVLLSRKALVVYLDNVDATPFGQGIVMWMGFPIHYIDYDRLDRLAGRSRWTFSKLVNYLVDGVVGYSFFPIRCLSYIGFAIATLGFSYVAWLTIARILWGTPVLGWSSIISTIIIFGGLQMVMLGIIGEYMWRTLANVRHRSHYVIDSVLTSE